MTKRGLVLVVGATGSGKSTSLAAMIGYRNENSYGHIITIEDPVEYVHEHKNCMITQREVGVDSDSWSIALKNTLRQAPDVILIGEVRDREDDGPRDRVCRNRPPVHGTLHANTPTRRSTASSTSSRKSGAQQLLMDLSLNLRAFDLAAPDSAQDGKGRIPAVEIMLNSPLISDLIFKGDVHEIKEIMSEVARARHADVRPVSVRPARDRADLLRRRVTQRRFGQRPAAEDQAEQQALWRCGRYPQGYRAHGTHGITRLANTRHVALEGIEISRSASSTSSSSSNAMSPSATMPTS